MVQNLLDFLRCICFWMLVLVLLHAAQMVPVVVRAAPPLPGDVLANPAPLTSSSASIATIPRLIAEARQARDEGRFTDAIELLSLYQSLAGPEARTLAAEGIAECARLREQQHRATDPTAAAYIASLRPSEALGLYVEVVEKLTTQFHDPARVTLPKLWAGSVQELHAALGLPAFLQQYCPGATAEQVAEARQLLQAPVPPDHLAGVRPAALALVRSLQAKLPRLQATGAILELVHGACDRLDPFTAFTPPHPLSGLAELEDFGLLLALDDAGVYIAGIVPESWAWNSAPLTPGDRLVRLAGAPLVTGAAYPPLTGSTLEFLPPGAPRDDPDARQTLTLPATQSTVSAAVPLPALAGFPGGHVVKIPRFAESTPRELDQVLATLSQLPPEQCRGLVLDLRGSVGGSFVAGLRVVDRFLASGTIASTQGQVPEFAGQTFLAHPMVPDRTRVFDRPVVVLVDDRTMSAAEVVVAALKDHRRAAVVGTTTFGKGVVQVSWPTPAVAGPEVRVGHLSVSVARLSGPAGRSFDRVGIVPHIWDANPARHLQTAARVLTQLTNGEPLPPSTDPDRPAR